MFALERIESADKLLGSVERVRRLLLEVAASLAKDSPHNGEAWKEILGFLEAAERPQKEIEQVAKLREAHRKRQITVEDLGQVMAYVDRAADEISGLLQNRFGASDAVPDWRGLGGELAKEFAPKRKVGESDVLSRVRDLIYAKPGLYITQVQWQLESKGSAVSYATVYEQVMALQERGDILTVGEHQGVPRYCFPHPAKIQNRSKYFGGLFGVKGIVNRDLTDLFEQKRVIANVFLVNHRMKEVLLVTPWGTPLKIGDEVEGFGQLEKISALKTLLPPLDPKTVASIDGAIVPRHLLRLRPTEKDVPLSNEFLAAFAFT